MIDLSEQVSVRAKNICSEESDWRKSVSRLSYPMFFSYSYILCLLTFVSLTDNKDLESSWPRIPKKFSW